MTSYSDPDAGFKGGKRFAGGLNRLRITTQNRNAEPRPFDYTWVANPENGKFDELILESAGGLKKESRIKTWSADRLSYDETYTLFGPDNQPVTKTVSTYEKFPFGMRKVRETRGSGGDAPIVRTWTYVVGSGNPAERPPGYGYVKRYVNGRGGWVEYGYTANKKRPTTVTRGGLDALPGVLTGARIETTTHSSTNPVTTRVTTIDGQEVSRSWVVKETTATTRIRKSITATVPGAAWDASTNLVSTTCTYTVAESDPLKRNQTAWTESPDGTMRRAEDVIP